MWSTIGIFSRRKGEAFSIIANYSDSLIKYLHRTFSVAALEVSFPRLLFATHWYSPLSFLFTFVIVNCFLSAEKLILIESLGTVHDIVGFGFPLALQDKVTLSPSLFVVWASGWAVILGWSVNRYQQYM